MGASTVKLAVICCLCVYISVQSTDGSEEHLQLSDEGSSEIQDQHNIAVPRRQLAENTHNASQRLGGCVAFNNLIISAAGKLGKNKSLVRWENWMMSSTATSCSSTTSAAKGVDYSGKIIRESLFFLQ